MTNLATFAQSTKTLSAVSTLACVMGSPNTASNTSLICTAGVNGALVSKISVVPRGTIGATAMYLFISKDNGVTNYLIGGELITACTISATTDIPETLFTNCSDISPLRLEPGDKLYIGAAVALAAGIVTHCQWTDF
ncbi:MAG: hypothetical protein NTW78_06040 [Campylobacterales bacterium]|nr:hypothetical protein [Campylobacterales bacterium]